MRKKIADLEADVIRLNAICASLKAAIALAVDNLSRKLDTRGVDIPVPDEVQLPNDKE